VEWSPSLGALPEALRRYQRQCEEDAEFTVADRPCRVVRREAADSAIEALVLRLSVTQDQLEKFQGLAAEQTLRAEKAEWLLAECLKDYHATRDSLEAAWSRSSAHRRIREQR